MAWKVAVFASGVLVALSKASRSFDVEEVVASVLCTAAAFVMTADGASLWS